MFALSLFSAVTLALSALNANAAVIPRSAAPPGWAWGYLENYDTYHTRYLALGCQFQHGKPFFDTCCHPMLATENLQDNRAPECTPSASASASAAAVVATEDCDDDSDSDSSYTPEPTPSSTPEPTPSSTPEPEPTTSYTPEASPSSSPEPAPSSSSEPAPTSSSKPAPTSSSEPAPTSSASSGSSSGNLLSDLITGGFGTFFYQNGVAGACGTVHQDSDFIVAMDSATYKPELCGKQVLIQNTKNGKSVTCTIADECPTCNNDNSIDMSFGAFTQIATESEGLIDIAWKLL